MPRLLSHCLEYVLYILRHPVRPLDYQVDPALIHQCLRDATLKDIEAAGLMGYYTMHSKGIYPADPNGVPFTAAYLQCTGDPIADITEDMAADAAMSKRQHFAQKKKHCPAWQCFFLRCINLSKK